MENDHITWTVIRSVSHLMEKIRDRELAQYGINTRQAGMLRHLKVLGDEATPVAIARTMFREPTSVSAILIRMEKQGLVRRVRDPKLRNRIRVYLTEKGEEAYRNASKRESVARTMSRLSVEDRNHLLKAMLEFRKSAIEEFMNAYKTSYLESLNLNLEKTSASL